MVLLTITALFEAKVERHCRAGEAGLHFNDNISLRKYEQSSPGRLSNTSESDYQTVSTSVGPKEIESMSDDDDHITIPDWSNVEKTRIVEDEPGQHTQNGNNVETWIPKVKEQSRKQQRIKDENKTLHSFSL